MPVKWKPDITLNVFIAHSQFQQNDTMIATRAIRHKPKMFHGKSLTASVTQPRVRSKHASYELEGVLEGQAKRLQKLAAQENAVKGLSSYKLEAPTSLLIADLERLRRDTGLAILATWNKHSRTYLK